MRDDIYPHQPVSSASYTSSQISGLHQWLSTELQHVYVNRTNNNGSYWHASEFISLFPHCTRSHSSSLGTFPKFPKKFHIQPLQIARSRVAVANRCCCHSRRLTCSIRHVDALPAMYILSSSSNEHHFSTTSMHSKNASRRSKSYLRGFQEIISH